MKALAWLCSSALALLSAAAFAQSSPTTVLDPPRGELRLVVLGDFNGPYGSLSYPAPLARTVEAITGVWQPDLLLSPGDVVAGQSRALKAGDLAAMWQAFDAAVAAPLREAGIPYAFAPGNHDASSLKAADGTYLYPLDRAAAEAYWAQEMYVANLGYLDRQRFPFDFTFSSHGAYVAVIDASSATLSAAQLAWLAETLATPEARGARLRIVVGHLPLAAVGQGRDVPGEVVADAGQLLALFERNAVDLYVSGHHAAYYPGRLGGVELLFAGGIGGRRLLGDASDPVSTVSVVDVWFEPLRFAYSTFDAARLTPLDAALLPPVLPSGVRLSDRATTTVVEGDVR